MKASIASWSLSALLALAAPSPAAALQLSVTQYGNVSASLPWAVALEGGFLAKNGLKIDEIIGSNGGGTTVRNMMAGDLPFAEVGTPAAIAASLAGIDVRIVYSAVNNFGEISWVVRRDSPLQGLADLKGRKAGFNNPRSTTEMVLRTIFQDRNMSKEVNLVMTGGHSAGLTMLAQGAVDAIAMSDPELSMSRDKYRVLFRVSDYIPNLVWTVGITTPAFAKAHPDTVRKLILARRQAVAFMHEDTEAAGKIYARVWQFDPATAPQQIKTLLDLNFWSAGALNRPGLESQLRAMALTGLLNKPVNLDALLDDSFLPEDQR